MAISPGLSVCCVGEVFAPFIGATPFIVMFLSAFSFTMNYYGSGYQLCYYITVSCMIHHHIIYDMWVWC